MFQAKLVLIIKFWCFEVIFWTVTKFKHCVTLLSGCLCRRLLLDVLHVEHPARIQGSLHWRRPGRRCFTILHISQTSVGCGVTGTGVASVLRLGTQHSAVQCEVSCFINNSWLKIYLKAIYHQFNSEWSCLVAREGVFNTTDVYTKFLSISTYNLVISQDLLQRMYNHKRILLR